MAKKQVKSAKTLPKKEKVVEVVTAPAKKTRLEVKTLEEATKLVEERYSNPLHLKYTVLSNGHVFYGINSGAARSVARRFGLQTFDVELK